MDYSHLFVCVMGMGTVFFGLICIIALTMLMSALCGAGNAAAPAPAPTPVPASAPAAIETDRQAVVAAVSAAIAESLGTDITGIRILSMKKL